MKSQILINTLMEIKDQAEIIPTFDNDKPEKQWLVNNQRHWIIKKLDALITVIHQEEP